MTFTRFNGPNIKATVRFSVITIEDFDLDLRLNPLTYISNIGNESDLRERAFTLQFPPQASCARRGRQQITQHGITPAQKNYLNGVDQNMHDSQFVGLASTLAGNATFSVEGLGQSNERNDLWLFISGECKIIALGLLACEEIQKSPFFSKISTPNETNVGIKMLQASCPTQPYQCRNQSILRAIEDL
ncbi:hypothetical protein BOTCAL_0504g00050 [Botryotinia calthae]|uniref:Uncharacterized protein n=1 Tax=Botryotinia calthae TaxID=38488 RepID=A0A4Y8CLD0_9HELO|nr:hypothetical protein BOTCAL_0504g00050 [Botryotinia calthae]